MKISKKVMGRALVGVAAAMLSDVASAYGCSGLVSKVALDNTGAVWVGNVGDINWLQVCNTTVKRNGFTPETCKYVHSSLLAAQIAQRPVTLYFNDQRTCQTHPLWENVENNGFFFFTVNP